MAGLYKSLILVIPCWIEAPWLPTVLGMLWDFPYKCALVKDLVNDVSIDQMIRGLPLLHSTHWQVKDMLHELELSLSVCQAVTGSTQSSIIKVYQQFWLEWADWYAYEGVPKSAIFIPH